MKDFKTGRYAEYVCQGRPKGKGLEGGRALKELAEQEASAAEYEEPVWRRVQVSEVLRATRGIVAVLRRRSQDSW